MKHVQIFKLVSIAINVPLAMIGNINEFVALYKGDDDEIPNFVHYILKLKLKSIQN